MLLGSNCTKDARFNEAEGLTFTGAPVTEPTEISGAINVHLNTVLDAPDGFWSVTVNDVAPDTTAFAERSAAYMVSIDGNWTDPAEDSNVVSWVRETWSEAAALGTGSVYLNFTSLVDEPPTTAVGSGHGDNLSRLAAIKAKYDPSNLFRRNNNILPAS